ncbi:hypothetical protein HNO88_002176 [Novosphingobium chloroacetimidivorans]|uniref:Uncharacterized protein n=1 Tax=Novosphingobium chloroacetimidivorans TaxID=1428314 RepID=A0A7W7K9U0_9SPHN|nr:hypothetical protein [Novosphingobium chloroacetimidivorans]MBB4858850.1 hypothetical protein [Novosphingobium chloroacetimidivorans]
MAIESIAAASAAASAAPPPRSVDLGSAVPQQPTPQMAGQFDNALAQSGAVAPAGEVPAAIKTMLSQLDKVNGEAKSVTDYAKTAEASGGELTPGEVVQLTMRCQEFMFHCQLTSNIANRSSDGIQQLFKQQG